MRGLARVERRATAIHVDDCLRRVWRRSLDGILFQGCIDLPEGSAAVEVERGFLCYECGCFLATVGAWRTHGAKVHGAGHPARALVFGTMCSGCCMEFHSRPRLLWHPMYSVSACLDVYASFFVPCDDATVEASVLIGLAEARALRRAGDYDRVAKLPAVRVHGCVLPAAVCGFGELGGVVPPRVPAGLDAVDTQRKPVEVHRYLGVTVYYVLHFFSGQRHPGDFQDWLDQSLALVHYLVWVISLDVAIGAKLCDLSCSVCLPAGLTLLSRVVLSWSSAARLVKLGVWPGGMVVPGPLVQGHGLLGPRKTFGACMILALASASRSRLAMRSCAQLSCSLQLPMFTALPLSWSIRRCPVGCLRLCPRGNCQS